LNKSKDILNEVLDLLKSKKNALNDNILIFWEPRIKIKKTAIRETPQFVDASGREKALLKKQSAIFNFLKKEKFVQELKLLSNTEATNWVKKQIAERDGDITQRAAQTLVSLVGSDLWQLHNEIEKLVNYKLGLTPKLTEGGKPNAIEEGDVEKLVRGNFDENIFALTDALSSRNKAMALKLLEEQLDAGLTDSYLINMIMRQFKILLQVREAMDQGWTSRKIISHLKLHPFVVQKGMNQVRNFDINTLKRIINQLIKIDYSMKIGTGDVRVMLGLLISKI
jgi:DNA polymerase-3 subunit delta